MTGDFKGGGATGSGGGNLACLALVDVDTISRALNHDDCVSESYAAIIRELASCEASRPNPLRSKRSQAIGSHVDSNRADASMRIRRFAPEHGARVWLP